MTPDPRSTVVVVGAGISGLACAGALAERGVPTVVLDRGRASGGRMSSRTLHGRPVDLGASYFTVDEPDAGGPAAGSRAGFAAVVDDWRVRGLARPWTDAFEVVRPGSLDGPKAGPVRYAAAGGLRSLVADLAERLADGGTELRQGTTVHRVGPGPTVDGEPVAAVVLAMPDPQAVRLLDAALGEERAALTGREWEPVLALAAGWAERGWPIADGAFVHDSAVLGFVADDGRRRGDDAPVLVLHSTAALARKHLDDPGRAVRPMLAELAELLGVRAAPEWTHLHRWSYARPAAPREEAFLLGAAGVGVCGDGWGRPKVETAWRSGQALGEAVAAQLGGPATQPRES